MKYLTSISHKQPYSIIFIISAIYLLPETVQASEHSDTLTRAQNLEIVDMIREPSDKEYVKSLVTSSEKEALVDPMPASGQKARGFYYNGPMARALGPEKIIRQLKTAKMNAAVIDLKDGQGRITYDTKIGILKEQKIVFLPNAKNFINKLRDAGIYTIARVVCFSDPALPVKHRNRAVIDERSHMKQRVWAKWGGRNTWLDPYNKDNQDLIVEVAKETEALGFDEIQLDYFRFPVDGAARFAVYPAENGQSRADVLVNTLRRIDEAIGIPIGVDVFGVAAFRWDKAQQKELGQVLVRFAQYAEVITPMLYINGMSAWMRDQQYERAKRLITTGVQRLRKRVGQSPVIRPFLQAFRQGSDYFNTHFISEQILGASEGSADGFLFWHPGSQYRIVNTTMHGKIRDKVPFAIEKRIDWRQRVDRLRENVARFCSSRTDNCSKLIDNAVLAWRFTVEKNRSRSRNGSSVYHYINRIISGFLQGRLSQDSISVF